ncbi:MATE family efflux transporter [bacterium]|nr:MATE family efflux transporter [bacterium]
MNTSGNNQTGGSRRAALTEGSIPRNLWNLAGPMVIGIVAVMVFNLVDTLYVARLGTLELAAISFTFPVVNMIGGLVMGLGVGVTAVLSQAIGGGEQERVRKLTRDALILSVSLVIGTSVIGILTIDPLFKAIGVPPDIMPLVREYMIPWYIGMPFLVIPMVGNSAIRATGDTRTPAMIMVVSAVLNIILDPLLIFGPWVFPEWGLAGAAIATVISRSITLLLSLYVLIYREKMIDTHLPKMREMVGNWASVMSIGLPASLTQILIPISYAVLTRIMAGFGATAVAAFGAGGRLLMFAMIVPMALGTAMTPFSGQNWGAGRGERVLEGVRTSTRFVVLYGSAIYLVLALLARPVASLFTPDIEVVEVMSLMIRINMIEIIFTGIVMIAGQTFNGLKRPLNATLLIAIRFGVFVIPMAWLGSHFFGLNGFFAGSAIGSVLTGIIAWIWIRRLDPSKAPRPQQAPIAASA